MKNSVLIIAAHPDDEVLGCGGSIAKFSKEGIKVTVAFLADGESSRGNSKNYDDLILNRRQNAKKALNILGCNSIEFLDYPDNRLDSIDLLTIVKSVETLIDKYKPYTIFTHFQNDLNIDHQITHKAVMTACRPQPNFCVKKMFFFEVPSSTEWNTGESFIPNYYIDITTTLNAKIKSLGHYKTEMRKYPHPRSIKAIENLAHYRGSSVGLKTAEAFIIGRIIIE
jgi:LmbE family N-acetylglucosaminyl deacetylase